MANPPIVPLLEIDAVNDMLSIIGETPVATLDDPTLLDAQTARQILTYTTTDVQTEGWWFNTERDYQIAPDVNGYLNLPANCLEVVQFTPLENEWEWDLWANQSQNRPEYVQRGFKIYDRANQTYVFPVANLPNGVLTVTMVVGLTFELMPSMARRYVIIRAGRIFQSRFAGDQIVNGYEEKDEMAARAFVEAAHIRASKRNMLRGKGMIRLLMRF